ncbi:MFS transporter [Actinomadura rugatobispora]|uniref:MFS transporter n=1 Tax=Actinomadura rugatobispora TaxID=1994 RepID=A0ABW0ZLV5_9ACTN|nr:MFS transporter [Actinomadura rugatobispora]
MTAAAGTPRRRAVLATLMAGTLLAPLNSSMVAVALVPVQRHYGTGLASVTWIVTAFYLTACVAQPVMGRIADAAGPRRVFMGGMAVAALAAAAAPFSPTLGALVACRALQAVGGATAFPCAMVMLRRPGFGGGRALTGIAAVNTISGAVGPVLGGVLVAAGGWTWIFWVNLPLTAAALVSAALLFDRDARSAGRPSSGRPSRRRALGGIDAPGIALFAAAVVGLLDMMLTLPTGGFLRGLLLFAVATALFVVWELRARTPFIDLRALAGAGGLTGVYVLFILFNLAYYGAFYGLPHWFQETRHFTTGQAGLLILPIAATGALVTVLAPALLRRVRLRHALMAGSLTLVAGLGGIIAFTPGTPVALLVADGVLLGLPYGLCNLGLQWLMHERAPDRLAGVAGGLFQSCRYLGAIAAVGLVGALAPRSPDAPAGITDLGIAMTATAVVLCAVMAADLRRHRDGREAPGSGRPFEIDSNPRLAQADTRSSASEVDHA